MAQVRATKRAWNRKDLQAVEMLPSSQTINRQLEPRQFIPKVQDKERQTRDPTEVIISKFSNPGKSIAKEAASTSFPNSNQGSKSKLGMAKMEGGGEKLDACMHPFHGKYQRQQFEPKPSSEHQNLSTKRDTTEWARAQGRGWQRRHPRTSTAICRTRNILSSHRATPNSDQGRQCTPKRAKW